MKLQSTTLSNQNITSALLVGTYTATLEVSDLTIQVYLNQIAGDGNYSIYATRQLAGAGAEYPTPTTTEAVGAGITSHAFAPVELAVNATDVVKVYVLGLAGDDTTPDVTCEFWGLQAAGAAGGSTSSLYASVAEFKAWLAVRGLGGSVGTDASDDTVLSALLEAVSRYFDHETGQRYYLDSVDTTRYFTTEDDQYVTIGQYGAITTVSVDYTGEGTFTNLTADTDYKTRPANAALDGLPFTALAINPMNTSGCYFPTYMDAVKILGKKGYPAVPSDVKDAVLLIAQSVNSSRSGQASAGKVSVTAGGIVIRPEDVPPLAQDIINHYRRRL